MNDFCGNHSRNKDIIKVKTDNIPTGADATNYLYLDNCTININKTSYGTTDTLPSLIMVRNCTVLQNYTKYKTQYIRNEEVIDINIFK